MAAEAKGTTNGMPPIAVAASEIRASSEQVGEPTQTASVDTLVGTWEADIHTRNGETYHEILTLSKKPYMIVSGKPFGFAGEQFSSDGQSFLAECDGYWRLILTKSSHQGSQAVIRVDGANTTSGRACGHEMALMALSHDKMVAKYVGAWLWPYPVGGLVTYRRTHAVHGPPASARSGSSK
ncbi:MAG TPA: hypothetical protein VMB73_20850 [Acetobacteraceae bacterium]|nr:hypothetical protein [Acetobacteraceae bacterium]